MKFAITIIILLIIPFISFAQQKNLAITLRNGATIWQSNIEELSKDSVKISDSERFQWVKVDSILEIREIKKSKFWQGAGIGFLGGATVGGVIAKATYKKSEPSKDSFSFDFSGLNTLAGIVAGGVLGFSVGGAIGASAGSDEVYDLSQKTLDQKLQIIKSIILKKDSPQANHEPVKTLTTNYTN